MWMVRLDLPMISSAWKKKIFLSPQSMQWTTNFLLYCASYISQVCLRLSISPWFNLCDIHLPISWILPIFRRRLVFPVPFLQHRNHHFWNTVSCNGACSKADNGLIIAKWWNLSCCVGLLSGRRRKEKGHYQSAHPLPSISLKIFYSFVLVVSSF